jgi:prevent-host-death family protein
VFVEVNVHEAKTHLSRLIERALAGEEVIIARAGRPAARLTRIEPDRPVLGSARGTVTYRRGWDKPLSARQVEEIFGA